ncbi:MAG: AbrB/MazE/SpoVT family DNA-binding domain-containing protein [Candidatus Schekmanbacteria bacterium]|nr:AbrB/MazE/SpoVT family DNA-binding domain-containing protein [Candidatus Schekmanbacteria bacterium]
MPVVKVKNKFQVTIPAEIRNNAQIKEGDILEVTGKNKPTVFKSKIVLDRESIDAAVNEGLKNYKDGRTIGPFKSVEEFKATLKK